MKRKTLMIIGVFFQIALYGQIDEKLQIDELIKKQNTFEIEFLMKSRPDFTSQLMDSIMLAKGLDVELEKKKKDDTTSYYIYKVEILPLEKSGYQLRLYDFKLKTKMSTIDTLNRLYASYFNEVDFIYEVNCDLEISKIVNKKWIKEVGKNCKLKEEEIKKYSYRFSNSPYTSYKSIQIPISTEEIENYLNLHIILFKRYQQDLTQKFIYPQEMEFPNLRSPVRDTLYINQAITDNSIIIQFHLNITENEIAELIDHKKGNPEQMMKPFNYHSLERLFLIKNNHEITRYTNESKIIGDDFLVNTILDFRLINGFTSSEFSGDNFEE